MNRYLIALASRSHLKWPKGLPELFTKAYAKLRKHILYPNLMARDDTYERIRDMALMGLVEAELKLDRWLWSRSPYGTSPRKSPVAGRATSSSDFPGKYFATDLAYIVNVSGDEGALGAIALEFGTRVFWVRARFGVLDNNREAAIDDFERVSECLEVLGEERMNGTVLGGESSISVDGEPLVTRDTTTPVYVILQNCVMDSVISHMTVQGKLDVLRNNQSLDEIQRLAEEGDHARVVDLLLGALGMSATANCGGFREGVVRESRSGPERQVQMLLLLDSLLILKDYKVGMSF